MEFFSCRHLLARAFGALGTRISHRGVATIQCIARWRLATLRAGGDLTFTKLRQEIRTLHHTVSDRERALNAAQSDVEAAMTQLHTRSLEIETLAAKIEKHTDEYNDLQQIMDAMSHTHSDREAELLREIEILRMEMTQRDDLKPVLEVCQEELETVKTHLSQSETREATLQKQLNNALLTETQTQSQLKSQLEAAIIERDLAHKEVHRLDLREKDLSRSLSIQVQARDTKHPAVEAVEVLESFKAFQDPEYKEYADELAKALVDGAKEVLQLRDSVETAMNDRSNATALIKSQVDQIRQFIFKYAVRFESNALCSDALQWAKQEPSRDEKLAEVGNTIQESEALYPPFLLQYPMHIYAYIMHFDIDPSSFPPNV